MKVSQLLFPYLKQNKTLNLQGLGTLTYEPGAAPVSVSSKDSPGLPSGIIEFIPDKQAVSDHNLIEFISRETGKIKPLASSDLESFIEIGKQLLNISKPFIIEGIGSLQRNGQGQLVFTQEVEISPEEETAGRKSGKSAGEEGVHFNDNYLTPGRKTSSAGSILIAASLLIIGIGLIGLVAWYFYNQSQTGDERVENANERKELVLSQPPMDSASVSLSADTLSQNYTTADTILNTSVTEKLEGFNVILEVSRKNRAFRRYADLKEWGHKVMMTTSDSVHYKLAIPVRAPLSDSIRHRDSLSAFFGKKVWIETN